MNCIKFTICIYLLLPFTVYAKTLVKIGNQTITSEDLQRKKTMLNALEPMSIALKDSFVLDSLVFYNLAIKEAYAKKMETDPEAKDAMEKALYNYYLFKTVDEKIIAMDVNENILQAHYRKDPELTYKRLFFPVNKNNKDQIRAKLALYRTDLNNGKISFDEVIARMGKNQYSSLNGLQNRVSAYSVLNSERQVLLKMQSGEISPIIDMETGIALLQLVKKYSYSEANKDNIIASYKREKIKEGQLKHISDLKEKYKSMIQYYK